MSDDAEKIYRLYSNRVNFLPNGVQVVVESANKTTINLQVMEGVKDYDLAVRLNEVVFLGEAAYVVEEILESSEVESFFWDNEELLAVLRESSLSS